MKRHVIETMISFVVCMSASVALCVTNENERLSKWRELVVEGSNHVSRIFGTDMKHSPLEWFCEMVKYELPTNDVEQYGACLSEKVKLVESASWILDTDRTATAWSALADFLSNIKDQIGPCNGRLSDQKLLEKWIKDHPLFTLEEYQRWQRAYARDRQCRAVRSRAVLEVEITIERVARWMPPERRKLFMETIISKTKTVPTWYKEMVKDGGTNTIKKAEGVIVP